MVRNCNCRSTRRDLAVALPDDDRRDGLLRIAEEFGWGIDADAGVVRIEMGESKEWGAAAEVANFLRTEYEPDLLDDSRAAIVQPQQGPREVLGELLHAEPLAAFIDDDLSPLAGLLEERRIQTWYQPVFAGSELEIWGYECLMRGEDEDGNVIYPDEILKWAFQEELQFMLDRLCRETHLRNAGERLADSDLKILINFLPTAIYKPKFCLRTTERVVEELDIASERVVFEVVETEEVEAREDLVDILEYYADSGFQVGLDDIGSGYAGLSMLADIRPNLLKIDRSIVDNVDNSEAHRQICKSLVEYGDNQDSLVLGEGVETPEQFRVLQDLGVDLYQGYLFGKPHPDPADTSEWTPAD